GVFNSTNIEYVLRNLGIRQLIVAGTVTDQCVDMAVRDGADRGFLVTCVSDACATYTQERHDGALRAFGGYCWVADTDTVGGRLAETPAAAAGGATPTKRRAGPARARFSWPASTPRTPGRRSTPCAASRRPSSTATSATTSAPRR